MQVFRFERLAEDAPGECVLAPVPTRAGLLVAVHGLAGTATVSAERRCREQVPGSGPLPGWQFSGREVWCPAGEVEVEPGVSRYVEVAAGDGLTLPDLRLRWSGPVECVLAVVAG